MECVGLAAKEKKRKSAVSGKMWSGVFEKITPREEKDSP